jgi:hypothetical protein
VSFLVSCAPAGGSISKTRISRCLALPGGVEHWRGHCQMGPYVFGEARKLQAAVLAAPPTARRRLMVSSWAYLSGKPSLREV